MAATFVPISLPVTCYGARSFSKRGAQKHTNSSSRRVDSPSGDYPVVHEHRAWGASVLGPTKDENWSRSRGEERLDWSFSQGEEKCGESWREKPFSPTLLGYEILEEREKLTVFKVLVTGAQGDSRMVFRRYTDFCSLNHKLKQLFPGFRAALPPASRCRLRNSYGKEFLEERLSRLQAFLQELTSHQDVIRRCVYMKLCAFCTLEEMNHHLQRELLEKQSQTDMLKKTLKEREKTIKLLLKKAHSMFCDYTVSPSHTDLSRFLLRALKISARSQQVSTRTET
uniref:PX domain-containing protein n=1 Tax=Salarias fasciatus TaxID=181472 RepID=A0A672H7J2_SALFA